MECRLCGEPAAIEFLNLGEQPLANKYPTAAELDVLARWTEKDLQGEKIFCSKLGRGGIFVCERLLTQIEELNRGGLAAQSAFHRRSWRRMHKGLPFASRADHYPSHGA
nr:MULTISPECIES: hypothetical protein [unclassified Mycobacterium]